MARDAATDMGKNALQLLSMNEWTRFRMDLFINPGLFALRNSENRCAQDRFFADENRPDARKPENASVLKN